MDADGAGEAAEVAFHQVVAGRPGTRLRPILLAGDDDHAALDQDAEVGGRHARDVEDQVEGVLGLEHVEQRQAFAGDLLPPLGPLAAEFVEQPPDVSGDVADVGGDRKACQRAHLGERDGHCTAPADDVRRHQAG